MRGLNHLDDTSSLDHMTDSVRLFASADNLVLDQLEMLGADDHHHPNPQIERAEHVVMRHIANSLKQVKDRQHRPSAFVNNDIDIGWQNARYVLDKPAARDVRQTLDDAFPFDQPSERGKIVLVWSQQYVANRRTQLLDLGMDAVTRHFEE